MVFSPSSPRAVGDHRFHDVADEGAILHASGGEAGSFVADPHDEVGGFFDLFHFVAVDDFLVAGEVDDARAFGAEFLADGEEHGVAESAAGEENGFGGGRFAGRAGGAHEDHGLAFLQDGAEIGGAAHFENDGGEKTFLEIDGGAGEGEAFHAEHGVFRARREGFVILQAIELAGLEGACGDGGAHDDFDDVRREADHVMHDGAEFVVEFGDQRGGFGLRGLQVRQHARDDGISLLRAAHGFDDVAGERGVQIAEEADGAAIGAYRHQDVNGSAAWRCARVSPAGRLHRRPGRNGRRA